tara:strand:- start:3017 stop:3208 length:192 start_codon:yes stop_codon:yes gene_type:complete
MNVLLYLSLISSKKDSPLPDPLKNVLIDRAQEYHPVKRIETGRLSKNKCGANSLSFEKKRIKV